jgi:predicted RNase H-related nuclease YkuK (DUF458 family)
MSDGENNVKPEVKEGGEHITIKIKSGSGGVVFFKVKPTTKFSKIFGKYYEREGISDGSARFVFDGVRIRGDQTPSMLDMENEDEVCVCACVWVV